MTNVLLFDDLSSMFLLICVLIQTVFYCIHFFTTIVEILIFIVDTQILYRNFILLIKSIKCDHNGPIFCQPLNSGGIKFFLLCIPTIVGCALLKCFHVNWIRSLRDLSHAVEIDFKSVTLLITTEHRNNIAESNMNNEVQINQYISKLSRIHFHSSNRILSYPSTTILFSSS